MIIGLARLTQHEVHMEDQDTLIDYKPAKYRKRHGLLQSDVAERANYSRNTIGTWERHYQLPITKKILHKAAVDALIADLDSGKA